jgi:hypothetical protein
VLHWDSHRFSHNKKRVRALTNLGGENDQPVPRYVTTETVMPKLLYFSERLGCGATFEMDDKRIVIISVAQSGVLVKAYKGKFSRGLFPFFGAILYNEKTVNAASKTSLALALLYSKRLPVSFKNPVLAAFANAIYNCSTAGEVARVLGEADARYGRAPSTELDALAERSPHRAAELAAESAEPHKAIVRSELRRGTARSIDT